MTTHTTPCAQYILCCSGIMLTDLYDEVYQLVFVHLLRVEVGNQETNIVTLATQTNNQDRGRFN